LGKEVIGLVLRRGGGRACDQRHSQSRLGIIIEISRRRVKGWWGGELAGRDLKAALAYEARRVKARACCRCLPHLSLSSNGTRQEGNKAGERRGRKAFKNGGETVDLTTTKKKEERDTEKSLRHAVLLVLLVLAWGRGGCHNRK
jgi:hypothetical protein